MSPANLQKVRLVTQSSFFALFCLAPLFDIFRFDIDEGHFYLLTLHWSIGIGENLPTGQLALNLLFYGILPIVCLLIGGFFLFYKYGRIYCGWLCPHFSVVETINRCMKIAIGKLSIWDKSTLPTTQADGSKNVTNRIWWILVIAVAVSMALIWSVVLLGYVINPIEVYSELFQLKLSFPKLMFLLVATIVLSIEFIFARHLFCRFGCAFGVFQSLAWMGNRQGLVISFEKSKAEQCKNCDNYCDHACPMRLKPRGIKRHMFSCTQCTQCLDACETVQNGKSVLSWKPGSIEDDNSVAIPISFSNKYDENKNRGAN